MLSKKIFLGTFFAVIFLSMISFVLASCGTAGTLQGTTFCDIDGQFKALKPKGVACVNDYECEIQSCVEGKCQEKFAPIAEQRTMLDRIWDFLNGIECAPGEDDCASDGKLLRTCGATGRWEDKDEYVKGRCGYDNGGGNGGRGCNPVWICTNWSNMDQLCGTRDCTDKKSCNKNWGKPAEARTCPGPNYYCGDGTCDEQFGETEANCPADCKTGVTHYCGDGDCNADESSLSCPEDCGPGDPPKNMLWLWILLIILLILLIIIVAYLIYRKRKKDKEGGQGKKMPPPKTTGAGAGAMGMRRLPPRGPPGATARRPVMQSGMTRKTTTVKAPQKTMQASRTKQAIATNKRPNIKSKSM